MTRLQYLVLSLMGVFTLASIALRTVVFLSHRDIESLVLFTCPVLGGLLAWRLVGVGDLTEVNRARLLKAALFVGLLLRLLALLDDLQDRPKQISDWRKYEILGQRLAFERRYYDFTTANGIELRAFRPPGLPLLLAASYRVLGEEAAPTAVMHLFSLLSLLLAYTAARALKNLPSLILFSYLSVSPHVLILASITNAHLVSLLIALGVLVVRLTVANVWIQSLMTGVIVGAGALVRSEIILLLVAALITLVGSKAGSLRARLLKCALAAFAGGLVIVPWSLRNCRVLGKCALLSTNSGSVLYSANVTPDFRRGGGYNGVGTEFYERHKPRDEVELDSSLRLAALQHIAQNFTSYLLSVPFRVNGLMRMQQWAIYYSERHSREPMPKPFYHLFVAVEQVLLWGLYLAAGIWLGTQLLRNESSIWLLSYVLIMSGYAFIFESLDRNHFPYVLMPLLAVSTGWNGQSRRNKEAER